MIVNNLITCYEFYLFEKYDMLITSKRYEIEFDIDNIKIVYPINNIIYKLSNNSDIITFLNNNNYVANELIDRIKVNNIQLTKDNMYSLLNAIFDANAK